MSDVSAVPWPDRRPGPRLAADLAAVDPSALSDDELIDVMAAWRRQASWAQAGELAAVAELARRRKTGASGNAEFTSAEVGLALTISPRSADAHLDLAVALSERLPLTRQALADGRIDFLKARVIALATAAVDRHVAGAVERGVLPGAPAQTPGRLRARVERAVMAVDPAGAERRRKASEAERRVECHDTGNGTAMLGGVHLPAGSAIAADNRLHAIAKAIKAGGDPRTLDQLSADVFLSLLLGVGVRTDVETASGTGSGGDSAKAFSAAGSAGGSGEVCSATGSAGGFGDISSTVDSGSSAGVTRPCAESVRGPATASGARASGDQGLGPSSAASIRGRGPSHGAGDGSKGRHADAPVTGGDRADPATWPGTAADAGTIAWAAGARIGTVHLTVPLLTLLGLSAEPGDVPGYGPLTAEITRQLAVAASDPRTRWCVTVTGSNGEPLHHGRLAYRPPPEMARAIRVLQPTCAFPGCPRPASACDLDHRVPYDQGGATCPCNVSPLCRRHHRAKQAEGWRFAEHDGRLVWTTPAGKTYTVRPDRPWADEASPPITGHHPNGPPTMGSGAAASSVDDRWRKTIPTPPGLHARRGPATDSAMRTEI